MISILGTWDLKVRENLFISSSARPGIGRVSGTFLRKSRTFKAPFPSLIIIKHFATSQNLSSYPGRAGMESNGVTVTKFLQFLMSPKLHLELTLYSGNCN